MSSTESKLMWVAIALSLLLVLALGTLAVYSVIGRDDDDTATADGDPSDPVNVQGETTQGTTAPASPGTGGREIDPPLSVRCDRATDASQGYAVIIANRGQSTIDYVVSIELTVAGSRPLVASTDVPALAPGERREVIVNAAGPGGRRISDCAIAAVQSDRRVLLANS